MAVCLGMTSNSVVRYQSCEVLMATSLTSTGQISIKNHSKAGDKEHISFTNETILHY